MPPPPSPHHELSEQLRLYLRESERILAEWDAYSDQHTDLADWPHDDHSYGLRASQRDSETAAAFEDIRVGARYLLAVAETQLAQLPSHVVQNRWSYQVAILYSALDRLEVLHGEWLKTRDALPADARPGTTVFDEALTEYHAEAWSYLDDWSTHGQTLLDINSAAQHAPSPLAPLPAAKESPRPVIAPRCGGDRAHTSRNR
ncbi:hypothetical protein ABZ820_04890 [Streptomyces diacarni]|uniref:hypothetical protein n=1 Tax=Streptomyces diacarni TaxID=2800381 RepID=UPI0033C611B1